MTRRSIPDRRSGHPRRYRAGRAVVTTFALIVTGWGWAPAAAADSGTLGAAVTAARPASCPPLKANPIIQEAAAGINRDNDLWLDHASRTEPELDAQPRLHDLGFPATKSVILHGAAKNEADSIKALLLQGWNKIPDCSFTDFGVNVSRGNSAGWILTAAVLAA